MNAIGSIGSLAVVAARPFAPVQAVPVVADAATGSGGSASASTGQALGTDAAAQYQTSVLSKVLYASADQALALMAMMPQTTSPTR